MGRLTVYTLLVEGQTNSKAMLQHFPYVGGHTPRDLGQPPQNAPQPPNFSRTYLTQVAKSAFRFFSCLVCSSISCLLPPKCFQRVKRKEPSFNPHIPLGPSQIPRCPLISQVNISQPRRTPGQALISPPPLPPRRGGQHGNAAQRPQGHLGGENAAVRENAPGAHPGIRQHRNHQD